MTHNPDQWPAPAPANEWREKRPARRALSFWKTMIACFFGTLLAGAVLWFGAYLYIDYKITQVSDAISRSFSEPIP